MISLLYIIWGMLPLLLFLFAVWAVIKPYLGVSGKEDAADYFKQACFCLLGLVIAIAVDRAGWLASVLNKLGSGEEIVFVCRALLFPGILVLMALIHGRFAKKPEKISPHRVLYR